MVKFERDSYGFWRQVDPRPFNYDENYKSKQLTSIESSWCRLGFLLSKFSPEKIKSWKVCDIGSGNGVFAREASKLFTSGVKEYDVCGRSISREELESEDWDLVFLTDVLEHYLDIEDLFKVKFKHAFISFPETPEVEKWEDLVGWRHFKPDEHVYCLNLKGMIRWLNNHSYMAVLSGNPEDAIRKPDWNGPNISTVVASRIR